MKMQLSETHLDNREALWPTLTPEETSIAAKGLPNNDTKTEPVTGLFMPLTAEIKGTIGVTGTADECTDTIEMETDLDGKIKFAAILQTSELSDAHELLTQAVRPTLAEFEGPLEEKLGPITVAEVEPDRATAECAAVTINGEFQENLKLIDLVSTAADKMMFDEKPCPDATFPSTALSERQEEATTAVSPIRTECENPEEEKLTPKTVTLEPALDGMLVTKVEDSKPVTTIEELNVPNPTSTDALTITLETRPNPEATLNARELSDIHLDLSEADPSSLGWGEALLPKNFPKTEILVLPDEEMRLDILRFETGGLSGEQTLVMALTRSAVLTNMGIEEALPLTLLNNTEESLRQTVRDAAVSKIRILCDREDAELKLRPRIVDKLAPVDGKFVKLTCGAIPTSNVNEFVNIENLT